ncbi:hypothetical protein J6590_052372 [Homalodisca vitripennis]|nr:hypothetical protein J6590_052372 [Homalodisca vitripennis]
MGESPNGRPDLSRHKFTGPRRLLTTDDQSKSIPSADKEERQTPSTADSNADEMLYSGGCDELSVGHPGQ